MNKGFTLVEVIVAVGVIGVLTVALILRILSVQGTATTVKCVADLEAFANDVSSVLPSGPAPTQKQVRDHIDWTKKYKDYWYLPNNKDFNSGHGNDLDGCDEENPGKSLPGRDCLPMRFLIICTHSGHGRNSDAKYCFKVDGLPAQIVPYEEVRHTYLQDAAWYTKDDPGWDSWIGAVPKK